MAVGWSSRRDAVADEALIREVYEQHGGALLAYATRLTGDRAAAEDVVQETLVRAWRRPDVLTNNQGSVRGWLLTVARNIVTDRFRARAARPLEVAAPDGGAEGPVRQDHAEEVVDSIVVLDALGQLSPEHRQVVTALYFQGHSVAEVADAVGVPPGTVKSRCYYALRRLREICSGSMVGQIAGVEGVAGE
jgi:RNA polymerase sigma-70 factor (ECF subfamily)